MKNSSLHLILHMPVNPEILLEKIQDYRFTKLSELVHDHQLVEPVIKKMNELSN